MPGEPAANSSAAPPPPPPPKPRLKLNVSRSSSFVGDASAGAPPASAATPTAPSATPSEGGGGGGGGGRKVKLKIASKSQPPTPATDLPPAKTKAGRQPKPTQKLVESKKRARDELDEEEAARQPVSAHPTTKIKLKAKGSSLTQLVVKPRGKLPNHPPGDGYDSEASDRELDPAVEEQLILRMLPGEDCDYVRQCVEGNKFGLPRVSGGAEIQLKFFEEESRRACVTVKGRPYAAVLVDLPTVTEAMKTWDKKSFLKAADICQMLLVYQQVATESEARRVPLPTMIDSHFKWPHGLTPPMHDCVNRRFAKTISRKEIEDKEAEVERLLLEDAKASSTRWEWIDERQQDEDDVDEDAEGEVDDGMGYYPTQDAGHDDADLEADLEAAFADDLMAETPATGVEMSMTPMTTQVDTPAAVQESIEESDDDDDDDDDDDEDEEELDDDARAQRDEEQGVKDIIADMQQQLASKQAELARNQNKILRTRLEAQIKQLKSEIELKKSSIGLETDD